MIKLNFECIVRPALSKDLRYIQNLLEHYGFNISIDHLKSMMVAEDREGVLIGVGLLNTILEATIMTMPNATNKEKVAALQALVVKCDDEAERLQYPNYHGFVTDPLVKRTLIKHFKFNPVTGDNLIRWIK